MVKNVAAMISAARSDANTAHHGMLRFQIARSSDLISRTLARMDLRKSMLPRVQTSRTITMDFKCSHDAACWATVVP